jgi:hypothetical protein
MSSHDDMKEMLPAYGASRLAEADRRRLEAHLRECSECAGQAASSETLAEALRQAGADLISPHPEVRALSEYALGKRTAETGTIASHLASCASCELEVSAWRLREMAREREQPARVAPGPPRALRAAAFSGSLRSPWLSLAAGLIVGVGASILVLLPLSPELPPSGARLELPAASRHAAEWSGPAPFFILRSPLRGESGAAQIRIGADQPYVLLAVRPGIPSGAPEGEIYRFELVGTSGVRLWELELSAAQIRGHLEQSELVTLPVRAEALQPGRYELRFAPRDAGSGQPPLILPFEVSR